jgi:hypothetical protein
MSDIRIPYGWCLIACIVFLLLAGWMGQLGAMWFCVSFSLAALVCLSAALLGYLGKGGLFQDVDRRHDDTR